jgi:hypothetical protein
MLWNPESECWYSVDPQSIPEDRSFLIFCETCQIEKANPSESVPGYSECGVKTLFIEPGSPWGNGYIESFNGKLRDELLDREVFNTPAEAKILIE